jgi:hypothetical protein
MRSVGIALLKGRGVAVDTAGARAWLLRAQGAGYAADEISKALRSVDAAEAAAAAAAAAQRKSQRKSQVCTAT